MDNINLIEEMRKMLRQELGNFRNQLNQQKNVQQPKAPIQTNKPDFSKAISIRDEIRKIVREELQAMKNQEQRKTQVVQQTKPVQSPQNNQQKQNKPQANVVRITSVEQLASHLQNAINQQLQKKQQVAKSVPQIKVTQNAIRPAQNQQQKSQSKDFAQKNTVSQKQAGDLLSNIARKVPKPQNNQQKK